MGNILLDKLIKTKLDNVKYKYSKEGWESLNNQLNKANLQGSCNHGLSFGTKFFLISGVVSTVIIGSVFYINQDKKSNPTLLTTIQQPVSNNKVVQDEIVKVDDLIEPAKVHKTIIHKSKNSIVVSSQSELEIPSLTEDSEIVDIQEVEVVSVKLDTPKIENISEPKNDEVILKDPDKTIPVPAKDVFKKKRRNFRTFFGLKRR